MLSPQLSLFYGLNFLSRNEISKSGGRLRRRGNEGTKKTKEIVLRNATITPSLSRGRRPPRLLKLSLDKWLSTRQPSPPEALLARMRAEIQKLGLSEADVTAKALADAGASILKSLDNDGCTDRASALDLLAADALFTYAFEAAADSRTEIEETSRYVLGKVTAK